MRTAPSRVIYISLTFRSYTPDATTDEIAGTQDMRQKLRVLIEDKWLGAAVLFEVLGLLAAFGTIPWVPGLSNYVAWMLSATAILSASGVVIVTARFMWQYNRRPLSEVQKNEVQETLSPFAKRKDIESAFAPKGELGTFIQNFGLYWEWQYQNSVVAFTYAIFGLAGCPGVVLVAELHQAPLITRYVRFARILPPTQVGGPCLESTGNELPNSYEAWREIFWSRRDTLVFYEAADRRIRYKRVSEYEKVIYNDRSVCPMVVPRDTLTSLPTLERIDGNDAMYQWGWTYPHLVGPTAFS